MVQVLYVTKAQECSEILHGVPSVFMWLSFTDHGMWGYAQCLNLQMLQNLLLLKCNEVTVL